jgi:hypothetical protein
VAAVFELTFLSSATAFFQLSLTPFRGYGIADKAIRARQNKPGQPSAAAPKNHKKHTKTQNTTLKTYIKTQKTLKYTKNTYKHIQKHRKT